MAEDHASPAAERTPNWDIYYTEKRILQQWRQVDLLKRLDAGHVLEIGPAMGLVTAMLVNAGYRVTTLDIGDRQFRWPDVPHLRQDLMAFNPAALPADIDTILCCETFEHLPWDGLETLLRRLAESPARRMICSVPYEGFQVSLNLYANLHTLRRAFFMKSFKFLKRFTPDADPMGHKWEVGYRGRALKDWEAKLAAAGWRVREREFTAHSRSVFHVLDLG